MIKHINPRKAAGFFVYRHLGLARRTFTMLAIDGFLNVFAEE